MTSRECPYFLYDFDLGLGVCDMSGVFCDKSHCRFFKDLLLKKGKSEKK